MEVLMGEEIDSDPVATEAAKPAGPEARPPNERRHFEFDIPADCRVSGWKEVAGLIGEK